MDVTVELVRSLVAAQFPEWSDLWVRPVEHQGNDNRTFRLGNDLSVRLPSQEAYAASVVKEDRWLPHLAEQVSVALPTPVATGQPTDGYPFPWSVRRWIDGECADRAAGLDRVAFAGDLAGFLTALRAATADDGPAAGRHSFYRGCHPSVYGDQVQDALTVLGDRVDADACRAIWRDANASAWTGSPVWVHGDIAAGNLLVRDGRLTAVIDFGACAVGDPACDLVIAWTLLEEPERAVFRDRVGLDDHTWARGRGWALWKALVVLAGSNNPDHAEQAAALQRILSESGPPRSR